MSILSRKQTNVHKFQKKKRDLFLNTSNAASPKQRKRHGEKSIKIKCHMRKRLGDKDKIKIEVSGFINSHLHMSALKIRLDFLEKIHSNKRKNKVNPNDNLKLSLSILPIEHKMLLYK